MFVARLPKCYIPGNDIPMDEQVLLPIMHAKQTSKIWPDNMVELWLCYIISFRRRGLPGKTTWNRVAGSPGSYCGRWTNVLFYNMLDVSGVAAFIIWFSLNADWTQQNASGRCTMFLQELGQTLTDEHLTACMQNPSTYTLVWSFHFEYLESSMQNKPKGSHMVRLPERDAKYAQVILTENSRCICWVPQKCLHKPCNLQCESSVPRVQWLEFWFEWLEWMTLRDLEDSHCIKNLFLFMFEWLTDTREAEYGWVCMIHLYRGAFVVFKPKTAVKAADFWSFLNDCFFQKNHIFKGTIWVPESSHFNF